VVKILNENHSDGVSPADGQSWVVLFEILYEAVDFIDQVPGETGGDWNGLVIKFWSRHKAPRDCDNSVRK